MKNLIISLLLLAFCSPAVFAGEPWAPKSGYCSINQKIAYNRFKFGELTDAFPDNSTYEHETQVYNVDFADITPPSLLG